ncbi:MAG: ABC transporter ATP-binding protein [Pseudomonadota bacterium]
MSAAEIIVEGVDWAPVRHGPTVLHATSFEVPAGAVMGIVGPNGAGKSTLLRMLYRFHKPDHGTVRIADQDIWAMPPKKAARLVAAVLQEQPTDFALTVREIVTLGRTPHRKGFAANGAHDRDVVDAALHRLDLASVAGRGIGTLSGGERQRAMVARALAQEPSVLVLDEPTNHLDIRHQLEVLQLIRELDLTVVTSLHDLNMAAEVCDTVLLLDAGRPLAFGPPSDVLSESHVSSAFRVRARREELSLSATHHMTFHLPH